MKHVAVLIAVLFIAQTVAPAYAQTCTEAKPVKFGDSTPCTGILWPSPWTVNALSCMNVELPRLKAEVDFLNGSLLACKDRSNGLITLCNQKMDELIKISEDAAGLSKTEWWESPIFWGIVGFISGSTLTIVVYQTVDR